MTRFTRSSLFMVAATIASVAAQPPQFPETPLASKRFAYPTGLVSFLILATQTRGISC